MRFLLNEYVDFCSEVLRIIHALKNNNLEKLKTSNALVYLVDLLLDYILPNQFQYILNHFRIALVVLYVIQQPELLN